MSIRDDVNFSAALACLDAYIFLRDKGEEALSLLRENKVDEAENILASALSFSRALYTEACDMTVLSD
ncbi:MAG: hypothetical protein J6P94_00500 [Oscillospiraceae bacterium]|nr:hypothetical protein [Oscillospiraceae bacterium]